MGDDDVLLGEIIVRASGLPGEKVARALAEVKKRRTQGEETDLASILTSSGLLDSGQVERFQREARTRAGPRDEELSRTLRLAYDSADPTAFRPRTKTGRYEAAAPQRRATGRLEPQSPPPPAPILPTVAPALVPQGRALVGRTWGSYEVLTEVARGAMGAIYRARDKRRGGHEVALKVLLQGDKADPEDVERFKREARALQKLSHPAIVRFYEYGVHEGCPFVTMDFVAGTTLESIIQAGGLSIDKGLVILEQVARAVDHAHSKGVVHRDLKPANVLIGNDNLARVTDFGLARILEEGARLTRAGDLIGTPLYMSPEQIRGELTALGPSSDVWSLGVTLYLLLTGEQPFGAQTIEDVAKRVKGEEPKPPRKIKPEIHEDLERICLTALQKDPKRRYQSAGEFANDLRLYLHGKPVLAGRVTVGMRVKRFYRSIRLRPVRLLVAALALVLFSFGMAHALGRSSAAPHQAVTNAALDALEAEVAKIQGRPPAESEAAIRRAYEGVAPIDSATDALRRARRAMAHRELARLIAKDDHEAARHLLTAASFAPADGTLSIDARNLLEQALAPLERIHDDGLAPLALQAVANVGEKNAPVLAARVLEATGEWGAAALALEPAAIEGLNTSQREQALVLRVEALLALEKYDDARASADALSEPLRALCAMRSRRGQANLGEREAILRTLLRDSKTLPASPEVVRIGLNLEWAELLLDAGRARAAREHLRLVVCPPELDRAAAQAAVLEARAQVLGRAPIDAGSPALDAVVARRTLPPPLRVDAALARAELALLAGGSADVPSDLGSGGAPAARRVLFAAAAPTVASGVQVLSRELWDARADASKAPFDPKPAFASLGALAASGDLEAKAWLYFVARASRDEPRSRDLARAVFTAGQGSSLNSGKLGHLLELDRAARLQNVFWRDDATPSPAALDVILSPPDPEVERLVAVADDRLAAALARVGTGSAPLGDARRELDLVERVLAVATRRDPFAASVWRMRAALALGRAELAGVVSDASALLGPAAAAVLLGPFDRASLAAMARACVAAGRPEAARLWAQRASSSQQRGEPTDADLALLAVLQGSAPQISNADQLGRLALLFELGHDTGLATTCAELRAQLSTPQRSKDLDAKTWARLALAWGGPFVDGCFARGEPGAGAPADPADALLQGAGCARETLRTPSFAASALSPLALVRRHSPHALAPRAYVAWTKAMTGEPDEAADAADDVAAALAIAQARGNGADKSHTAQLALALAEARLSPTHVFRAPGDADSDTSFDLTPFLTRFGLHQEK